MKQKIPQETLEDKIQELESQVAKLKSHQLQIDQYRHMLNDTQELSKIGSWNWDLTTNSVEWSDTMFRLMGLDPNEAVPSYELALHHVHDKDKVYYEKSLEEAINNKSSYYLENRITMKNNAVISVISRGKCYLDAEGNMVGMIGTVQNITEQQNSFEKLLRVNKEVKKKEKQLNEAQRLSKVGSWDYDPQTKRFQWSNEMYRIFALDSKFEAPTYTDLKKLIHPEDWKEFDEIIFEAAENNKAFHSELRLLLHNGLKKTVTFLCQPVIKDIGERYLLKGTIQDITTLKVAENNLMSMNFSLEEKVKERTAELMYSLEREKKISDLKSNFVSITSHEFRTPLTIINLSAMLIEKNTKLGKLENIQQQVDKIRSAVLNLVQILDDLLTIGKIEGGKIDAQKISTDIKKLTQALLAEISTIAKKGQKLNYTHQGSTDSLIDVNLFGGVFLNLITNAIKYSEADIDIKTKVEGRDLVISVADKGIGIPIEDQKKIFSKYFRGRNAGHIAGTGLGLNIVFQYVQLLKGSIKFSSIPGKGTTFTVVLPS
ncbi:ATP-binding protein [Flavobacteriaceae bacterium KMM 6898]|nr:ATP-binding protein [Flavobacteriaceae bacterium KMM 6898]